MYWIIWVTYLFCFRWSGLSIHSFTASCDRGFSCMNRVKTAHIKNLFCCMTLNNRMHISSDGCELNQYLLDKVVQYCFFFSAKGYQASGPQVPSKATEPQQGWAGQAATYSGDTAAGEWTLRFFITAMEFQWFTMMMFCFHLILIRRISDFLIIHNGESFSLWNMRTWSRLSRYKKTNVVIDILHSLMLSH